MQRGDHSRAVVQAHGPDGMVVTLASEQEAFVPAHLIRNNGVNDPPPVGTELTAVFLGTDHAGRLVCTTRLKDLPGMWTLVSELPAAPWRM